MKAIDSVVTPPFLSVESEFDRDQHGSHRNSKGTASPTRQPLPSTPGVTKQMIRNHARILFRDQGEARALSRREWRLVEEDLVHKLESDAF